MNSENDISLKKAVIENRKKIKVLKNKKREITKEKEKEEKKDNNSKNNLDDLIKLDEENINDEILNDEIENNINNKSYHSSNNNNSNIENIIDDKNSNYEKKEKEEIDNLYSDIKEEPSSNIKQEIVNSKEKKTKPKILIKKIKKFEVEIKPSIKKNEVNKNTLIKNKTLITKIERNPKKVMKKSMTTYSNKINKRKFDPVKFNEYLKGIDDYENKKKEKIENMRKQKEEKELKKETYHPKINKDLKYKVNPKNYSTIERLYTQDLIKRKEKKQILTKIYTPSFKPKIYTNKYNTNRINQKNIKT